MIGKREHSWGGERSEDGSRAYAPDAVPISVESVTASSEMLPNNGIRKAFDGVNRNSWCSEANPQGEVVITILLAGRFHVRKLELLWEEGGPKDYQVSFSRFNGHEFEWLHVATKKDMPSRGEEIKNLRQPYPDSEPNPKSE